MRRLLLVIALYVAAFAAPTTAWAGEAPAKPVPPAGSTTQGGAVPMGSTCRSGLCSQIENSSQYWVYLARDWCGTANYIYNNTPPCGPSGTQHPTRYLDPNVTTPQFQDWDSFRVDAGWKYNYTVYFRGCICWSNRSVDRRGSSTAAWVRVHDNEVAVITSQTR
jgi:hypothetical protein